MQTRELLCRTHAMLLVSDEEVLTASLNDLLRP